MLQARAQAGFLALAAASLGVFLARRRWRTGTGRYRNVAARARDGVEHVEPSLEDAYLLLRGELPDSKPAEEVAS